MTPFTFKFPFYKVLRGHDNIKWKREPEKLCKEIRTDKDGPASRNSRPGVYVFVENLRKYLHLRMSSF